MIKIILNMDSGKVQNVTIPNLTKKEIMDMIQNCFDKKQPLSFITGNKETKIIVEKIETFEIIEE